ncbi:EpsG family protein [Lachnoclostridium sp. Marseille-P6806]|uniref:EpsG family protein n=1 Tax=Lachnoclostridium sp. Marseille-P6806 TaxID=2364793 RepID=UPI00103255BD|nr:EpsG family protein [Lachnoclostridium sp. Marseille-P6806]
MIVYLIVTGLALLLASQVRRRAPLEYAAPASRCGLRLRGGISRQDALSRLCLALLFSVLVIPEALRVNTGNDYAKYVDFFHNIDSGAYDYVATEFGFNAVVRAIYSLSGFENYLLVFAVFAALTAGFFLLAMREQAENFPLTFFLFMMFGYYFQSYNTVRYYFVLAVVLWALRFLLDGRIAYFVLVVLAAASFHKSVLIVLVLYPLALLPWRTWMLWALALLGGAVYATKGFWLAVAVKLYPSYAGTEFLASGGISWSNVVRCAAVIGFAWLLRGRENAPAVFSAALRFRRNRFYYYCEIEALFLYVFASFIPFISRIGYYLTITQIFFLPELLCSMPEGTAAERRRKKAAAALVVAAALLYFVMLLRKMPDETIKLLPYKSFLFHEMPAIWSDVNR